MQTSAEGRKALTLLEGKRARAYKDVAGLLTIGVGHLLTKSELFSGKLYLGGRAVKWGDGLTDEEIDALLAGDLKRTEDTVAVACPTLTQSEFDALISFTFNVGASAFLNSGVLRAIRAGKLADVPAQLRRWVYAGGTKIAGLAKRRETEVLMWSGEYVG